MSFIVAIDGPAGSGKGSITKIIAEKMNLSSIDTGAMYRCVTLDMINKGIAFDDIESVRALLEKINIVLDEENGKVLLNGEDVTSKIRSVDVSKKVSEVSAIKEVRIKLVEMQRKIAKDKDIIMEGRDITTVVFPNADVKIYLDASVEERAKRRYKQNQESGIDSSYEEILENIKTRDYNDMHKDFGALVRAEDAVYLDSSNLSIEEVTDKIMKIIKDKKKN
ncbi:MAG: (d)CMP kinase [Clostridia bacterium]|nr:(d)CMP kinase [Clostridia bacterium]